MIRIRVYSTNTELDFDVEISPDFAYEIINKVNPPHFPTRQEFEKLYVDKDFDYDFEDSGN